MLLAKLLAARSHAQLIAMSATMAGLEDLSGWLSANLFLTNFRPVPLTEHAVFGGVVFRRKQGAWCWAGARAAVSMCEAGVAAG
jgi:DNA polymerase theta